MILLSFENGDCLRRQGQSVIAEFTGRRRCLSTSPLNGGIAEHLTAVFNHDCLPPDGSWFVMKEATYEEHLRATASSLGLNPDTVSGMITTAQMDSLAIAREEWRGTAVTAAVTAGIDKNGGRAGDRADWHEGEDCPLGGTVNIMLFFSADLPPGTLARALVTCTEAKTAALQELLAPSCYSDGLATGSGTDSAILVSDAESPLRLTYAGKHCKLGEMIGCAVIRAVKESLFLQTGLNAERQLNLYARLGRFGVTRELLTDGLDGIAAGRLDALARQPRAAVFASLFAHLLDQLKWGMIPLPEARCAAANLCRGMGLENEEMMNADARLTDSLVSALRRFSRQL
ncbi:MAG: adenosylcobinamide amidohydrolase [Pyramidobacter sp.]|nr:adenosylcobinamide amidohydrolase [Pyramidobacter sp.]